jgi:hypothetical protein
LRRGLELRCRSDKGLGIASAVLRIANQEMNLFSNPAFAGNRNDDDPPGMDDFCREIGCGRSMLSPEPAPWPATACRVPQL